MTTPVNQSTVNSVIISTVAKHPKYELMYDIWQQLKVTGELGEREVKLQGETYLPKTSGQLKDGTDGNTRYEAYKQRAVFYNYVGDTVSKGLGMLHTKASVYKLPKALEPILKSFTINGEPLDSFHRDLNKAQLNPSRIGLLVDMPETIDATFIPYIVKYNAMSIVNWDESLDPITKDIKYNWILCDESCYTFDQKTKSWTPEEKYRLFALRNGIKGKEYYTANITPSQWTTWNIENPDESLITVPRLNGKSLTLIPFVICNVTNINGEPEYPLLENQSNLSLSLYRQDADYRQALFMQAFSILALLGFTEDEVKGGVYIDSAIRSTNEKAKVEYAGVNGNGLMEMREAHNALKNDTRSAGLRISEKEGVESGKALEQRIALTTNDLLTIAKTSGEAITKLCMIIAEWMGLSDAEKAEISIVPNTDFNYQLIPARDVFDMYQVVAQGGMTNEDYYNWLKQNDLTKFQTYGEWKKAERAEIIDFSNTVNNTITEGQDDDSQSEDTE